MGNHCFQVVLYNQELLAEWNVATRAVAAQQSCVSFQVTRSAPSWTCIRFTLIRRLLCDRNLVSVESDKLRSLMFVTLAGPNSHPIRIQLCAKIEWTLLDQILGFNMNC
jgi:hypothetical protein